MSSSLEVFSPD